MDTVILALAPLFIFGFAIQQLNEFLLNPLYDWLIKSGYLHHSSDEKKNKDQKKNFFGLCSFLFALIIVSSTHWSFFEELHIVAPEWVQVIVTALFISSGTEGFNSIAKFLSYAKEKEKEK